MAQSKQVRGVLGGLVGGLAVLAGTPWAMAEEVTIGVLKDTSMYSEGGDLSNGSGEFLFAGQTLLGDERRALIAFDVSGIPAGSTITSVSMTLNVSEARPGTGEVDMWMYRVTGAWGEGSSNAGTPGGAGILAEAGDATWTQRVVPGTLWNLPGGDYAPTLSALGLAGEGGPMVIASTPELVADVQGWVNGTFSNDGWILMGDGIGGHARRFSAKQNGVPSLRPTLTVAYTPGSSACPADLDNGSGTGTTDGGVDINDLLYFLTKFEQGAVEVDLDNGSGTGTPDGGVDINDLLFFLVRFEAGC